MPLDPRSPKVTVVSAPAGSGKTTLLLHHYLRHLNTVDVDRIVAITFTRKAAAELTSRLARVLTMVVAPERFTAEECKANDALYGDVLPPVDRARRALASLQSAPVSTVDAFTLSLVQSNLLHAGLPLSDGTTAWIDAPVVGSASTRTHYESAARAVIEELSEDVRVLLGELVVGEAITELAFLAQNPDALQAPGTPAFLDALGDALRAALEASDTLRDASPSTRTTTVTAAMRETATAWLADPKGRPPLDVVRFLARVSGDEKEAVSEVARDVLRRLGLRDEAEATLPFPDWDDALVTRSEPVVAALRRLAATVRDRALTTIAAAGTPAYDELLMAATMLCRSAPPELAGRYDVLMVDELQDTNPQQLDFYRAFAGMRQGDDAIHRFFVGDGRQSIYRFRGADPHGWVALLEEAKSNGTFAELTTNYRSTKLIIDAQKAFVAGVPSLESLEVLAASPRADEGLIDGRPPVLVVNGEDSKDVSDHVLAQFAQRLQTRWQSAPTETAAVLVSSWNTGAWAVRELAAHGVRAQLTGDKSLVRSRAATDLRLFLRALLDPSDDVALVGVLKHPSIGLSDRALLHLKDGGALSRVLSPDVRFELPDVDAAILATRLDVFRQARHRLGREPTADVLEWLAAGLNWRAFIHAGPDGLDGIGVAQLEVLFDVVRGWEAQQVDPYAIIAKLEPDDAPGDDLPVIRMGSGDQVVEVTTVHSAKGLEYDHVALLDVEPVRKDRRNGGKLVSVARPLGATLLGLSMDPKGALNPRPDPMTQWAGDLLFAEARHERWRLFYVGFTRAKKTVTFGIMKSGSETSKNLAAALRTIFVGEENGWCEVVEPDDDALAAVQREVRRPLGQARAFESKWATSEGWTIARPSSAGDAYGAEVIADFKQHFVLETGPDAPPLPALPWLKQVDDSSLGQMVHGWLEAWGFRGEPTVAQAQAYLERQWGCEAPALAAWVVELGLHVRTVLGPMLDHTLHFEWPLVAVDDERLWTGRADLIVELEDRKVVVIDFKAGAAVARDRFVPHVEAYAPQLEAYRRMLESAGYQVVEVGLLFVRGVTWARRKFPIQSAAVA